MNGRLERVNQINVIKRTSLSHVLMSVYSNNFNKRSISEKLFINRQKNGINLQTDTAGLHQSYVSIIDRLPKL